MSVPSPPSSPACSMSARLRHKKPLQKGAGVVGQASSLSSLFGKEPSIDRQDACPTMCRRSLHNGCDTLKLGFDHELRRLGFAGNSCQIILELSTAVDSGALEKRVAEL